MLWRGRCLWMRNAEGREKASSCDYGLIRRSGGWGPEHSSLEYSCSWKVEKPLFTKNILKIRLRNEFLYVSHLGVSHHSFIASRVQGESQPRWSLLPKGLGLLWILESLLARIGCLKALSAEFWLSEEAARLPWPQDIGAGLPLQGPGPCPKDLGFCPSSG